MSTTGMLASRTKFIVSTGASWFMVPRESIECSHGCRFRSTLERGSDESRLAGLVPCNFVIPTGCIRRLAQRAALARAFGCARVVFNDALAAREAAFKAGEPYILDAALSKRRAASKATPERAWLTEVSSVVLQQALADLNAAYRNFFESANGKRKGPKAVPPRFRSRKESRQSIRFTSNGFRVLGSGRLRLSKVGGVEVRWSRALLAPAGEAGSPRGAA